MYRARESIWTKAPDKTKKRLPVLTASELKSEWIARSRCDMNPRKSNPDPLFQCWSDYSRVRNKTPWLVTLCRWRRFAN